MLISPRTGSAIVLLTQEDDDRARSKASDIIDIVVLALAEEGDLTAALDTAIQAVNLMSDIRFTSWSTRYIAESCMYVCTSASNNL